MIRKNHGKFNFSKCTREEWHILTALRGPDSDNYDLKSLTTAVIRSILKVDEGVGADVETPESAKIFWSQLTEAKKQAIKKEWKQAYHFRYHIVSAFSAMSAEYKDAREYFSWLVNQID